MTDCSIVIPTRDRPAQLARAVASVLASCRDGDELIVASVGAVQVPSSVRVVRPSRFGASAARNAGLEAATHPLVLYTDDDVTVDAGWVGSLARSFELHPEVGFVTGRVLVPPDQEPVDYPVAVITALSGGMLTAATTGMLGHSSSLGVRRGALTAIGGWDERLGAGVRFRAAEDLDVMDRLLAAGWPGWYEPSALAWHDQWRTRRQRLQLAWAYGIGMGARLSKLHRVEPRRARRIAREVLWDGGLRDAAHHARLGYRTAFGINVLNAAGTLCGWATAAPIRVEAGRFAADH